MTNTLHVKIVGLVAFLLSGLLAALPTSGQMTSGNILVYEKTNTGLAFQDGYLIRLREFTPNGTPGMVMDLPTTGPHAILGDNSTNGHSLTRTPDGSVVVLTGYATYTPQWAAYASTPSSSIPRVVGYVDVTGGFSRAFITSTHLNTTVEAAVSDGTHYWVSGTNGQVVYMGPGPQAVVTTANGIIGQMGVDNGQLSFAVSGGSTAAGVYDVGGGTPTTAGHGNSNLFLSAGGSGFAFNADRTVCYKTSAAAVQKWTFNGAAWSLAYSFTQPYSPGLSHVCVDWSATYPYIYATTAAPSSIIKWQDLGNPAVGAQIAQSSGAPWHGISLVPMSCIEGAPCNDGDPDTGGDRIDANCVCAGDIQQVSLKVGLQGPYVSATGLMNDQLRTSPFFPLSEPFTAQGLGQLSGPTTINAAVLVVSGNDAIVDWILMELRDSNSPSSVLWRQACLLQRDGDVVKLDGVSPLSLPFGDGSYHVAVRHRNHLGAMTAAPVNMAGSVVVDFTDPTMATYGTDARCIVGSDALLWQGNVFPDNIVKYTGANNDRDVILSNIGGTVPTNAVNGYFRSDTNLDGTVKYTGPGNDRDPILVNIGGTVPTNQRVQQLP